MNPGSGKLHKIAADLEGVERIAKGESPAKPSVEDELARATAKLEGELAKSSEPPPGAEVPADWPRFRIGEKVGPIKGWWFELVDVDVEAQEMLVRPLEPTRGTAARRAGKPRKRRKMRKVKR